jgi:hypothetical protein
VCLISAEVWEFQTSTFPPTCSVKLYTTVLGQDAYRHIPLAADLLPSSLLVLSSFSLDPSPLVYPQSLFPVP